MATFNQENLDRLTVYIKYWSIVNTSVHESALKLRFMIVFSIY